MLFLALSMFIIAAALMLVWLLFRLGIEQRAGEIGTLLALGWTRRQTAWALLAEGSIVAASGAAIGVAGGVAYAWVMIVGLRSWWSGAIAAPSLQLYMTPTSLIVGWALGLAVSCLTIWFSLRGLRNVPVRRLMAGEVQPTAAWTRQSRPGFSLLRIVIFVILLVSASGLAMAATMLGGEAQAGAFLGAGALVLVALLLVISGGLKVAGQQAAGSFAAGALPTLAVRNAARSASRSVTTIALMASAAFLIVAVSSFRLRPSDEGTGGFNLLAESAGPVIDDLGSQAVRKQLLASQSDELAGTTILPLRLQAGDDASCRNLYQPSQPRVLGVTPAVVQYFDNDQQTVRFRFAASAARATEDRRNPWRLVANRTPADQPVPVVLDKNTAMFSLRLYRGIGEEFKVTYEGGPTVRFQVAGLLENSVLQGSLLVSEANFTRLFPQTSGYRFFLIRTPPDKSGPVAALLEDKLGDEGFDTADARLRLAELLAVQNTYISTFQALGALGLVLGTFGLAAVQLRNVFERRKELALLRAAGFRRLRLGAMVLLENLLLLLGGLATGAVAALVTVLPHMLFGGASVPLAELTLTLGAVLLIGIATGLVAVRATLRAPLVAALRGE